VCIESVDFHRTHNNVTKFSHVTGALEEIRVNYAVNLNLISSDSEIVKVIYG